MVATIHAAALLPYPGAMRSLAALLPRASILAAALTLACGCGGAQQADPAGRPVRLTLPALDGGEIRVHDHRGAPVVLHFFTTGPLSVSMDVDELQALHDRAGREVAIVGVSLDDTGYRVVAPWRDAMGIDYLIALATGDLRAGRTALGRITTVPTTVVLRGDGTIFRVLERPLAAGEIERLVDAARR